MKNVVERLYVGTDVDCRHGDNQWAIVHACKSPCHQREVGYRGSLPNIHPNYLVLEKENDLVLNIIDPPVPLFKHKLFIDFLSFTIRHWENGKNLLIHCNMGESRAPSLALLFLSKHLKIIPNTSYDDAKTEFSKLYPGYTPGLGIQTFLRKNWNEY
jgi:hypothetical protein